MRVVAPPNVFTISRKRRELHVSFNPNQCAPIVGCIVVLGGLLRPKSLGRGCCVAILPKLDDLAGCKGKGVDPVSLV